MRLLVSIFIICFISAYATSIAETSVTSGTQSVAEVDIIKFKFIPQHLEIKKGQTVRWTNREKRQYHSVWFEKHGEDESEYLFPEDKLEKTFDKAGVFEYRCGPHPEMTGKIIVQ